MSEINHAGALGRFQARYDKNVLNAGSEAIPPWSIVQVVSAVAIGGEESYTVAKPTSATKAKYFFTGPQEIAGNGPGSATDTFPAGATWAGLTPPSPGAEWGPVSGSWSLSVNGKGFLILGGVTGAGTGTAKVAAIPPAATNGADFPLIRIQNVSGLARASRSIVGIGLPVDPPPGSLLTQPTFQSANPTTAGVFAVLMNDVAVGDIVDAAPLGVVACQLNYTDSSHTRAESVNGDYTKLRSTKAGRARILWRQLQGVSGGGTFGVQWAYVFIESGGQPLGLKQGLVRDGYPITAATGDYLQARVPGIGQVYEYASNPSNPLQVDTTVSGNMVAGENAAFWVTWMPTISDSRKPVIGLTDENGITWVVEERRTVADSQLQWGEVVATIAAAPSWEFPTLTEGAVQFYKGGVKDGDPVDVENQFPSEFPNGVVVCCDRSFPTAQIVSGSCEVMPPAVGG